MRPELAALAEKYGWSAEVTAEVASIAAAAGHEGPPSRIAGRYEDLGPIGRGGAGEVRRVRDHHLDRDLAMKLVHAALVQRPEAVELFVAEARSTAQLQHPSIVPVHDAGTLPDGRAWFTMKVIEGRTLAEVIAEVHAASVERWEKTASGWDLHRLITVLVSVCRAVAFAHERGVIHRDLKPENTMVGAFGEVYVVDWGIAKLVQPAAETQGKPLIVGTPAYMSPEQARGQIDAIDARSDVYALGAILYEILSGRPPYEGAPRAVLTQVIAGPPAPIGRSAPTETFAFGFSLDAEEVNPAGPPLPGPLVEICERAMQREPQDRFPTATAVADALQDWLSGAKRREQALSIVARAEAAEAELARLTERAIERRNEGKHRLEQVAAWAPEDAKSAGWACEDEAEQLERAARLQAIEVDQLLNAALQLVDDLPEAHRELVRRYRARHEAAEKARNRNAEAESRKLLEAHAAALPETDPVRRETTAYLRGLGALTLVTDPPGAEVLLYRFEEHHRRLVEQFERSLGTTPLLKAPLPMGRYLCVLRHPDCEDVRYPVEITRQGHWDGIAPGTSEPHPIALPRRGTLDPDEVYIPAGWFHAGGDGSEWPSLAPTRLWCNALVMARYPVTNREYLDFLNDLVDQGRESEALTHAPRERAGSEAERGALVYAYRDGRFSLRPDAEGDAWHPDWPVLQIDWFGARAYLEWRAARTGKPWRLPAELEWEKAARGVDGRRFPWGDHVDASWCRARESARGREHGDFGPVPVDSYPVDVSVYGVRGMGGNAHEWCADEAKTGGATENGATVASVTETEAATAHQSRSVRGGTWNTSIRFACGYHRFRSEAHARQPYIGLRGCFEPRHTP